MTVGCCVGHWVIRPFSHLKVSLVVVLGCDEGTGFWLSSDLFIPLFVVPRVFRLVVAACPSVSVGCAIKSSTPPRLPVAAFIVPSSRVSPLCGEDVSLLTGIDRSCIFCANSFFSIRNFFVFAERFI